MRVFDLGAYDSYQSVQMREVSVAQLLRSFDPATKSGSRCRWGF